jgi:hypothetical protein
MIPVNAYAAQSAVTPLAPFSFERRELGPHDIQIDILYCGFVTPIFTRPAMNGEVLSFQWFPDMKL